MFLLSSAASLHGHEFSPVDTNPTLRRIPLPRSAFSTPLPRRSTVSENSLSQLSIRPVRPLSAHASKEHEPVVRFQEPEPEPEPDAMSEDGRSIANSETSEEVTVDDKRRRRRYIRSRTSFHLAQPAPTRIRLLHIRPKLLLQLQCLSTNSRPKPAIDVIPSTIVVPRLMKKFPRMFRGKAELGANDVMVLRSEDYDIPSKYNSEDEDLDEEGLENRDLLAVICQLRKDCGGACGKAEIVLGDGSVWIATPLPNNLYEFVTVDDRGNRTTARWVRRSTTRKSMDVSEGLGNHNRANADFKLTFSIINPNSRRHPVMATLHQNRLDIPDHYTVVASSATKSRPTSPTRLSSAGSICTATEEELTQERTLHAVDESLKILIQVTGIWVTLREGFSPYFKYNDTMASVATSTGLKTSSGAGTKPMSPTLDGCRISPAVASSGTPESSPANFGSMSGKFRRSCGRGSPASGNSSQTVEGVVTPKRTVSTGTAFMQRAAARRSSGIIPSAIIGDGGGGTIFDPPRRAATESSTATGKSRFSMPPGATTPPDSSTATPNTPTRPQRRVQSTYIPTSALQHSISSESSGKHSLDLMNGTRPPDIAPKAKAGRWKAFTRLFRRINSNARGQ
ncbi:uncharacterized protein BP5553_03945 [Venustampulla echinocandica]|uniref:Uncharacterized protein n=1 Tax=Venustampulla echinocandica TaxID=2656787 RepID=A0A370TVP7_9HELO|nr:uncharacterized protein BP5553_03945 [Venustampulla echinocandica]RDL39605.1 hypothetical protein BP5553_03945 [Venustampulla echinocandica]